MTVTERDLSCSSLWSESLDRSRIRRARGTGGSVRPRNGVSVDLSRREGPPRLTGQAARDLALLEHWEQSQHRSRLRRETEPGPFDLGPTRRAVTVAAAVAATAGPTAAGLV